MDCSIAILQMLLSLPLSFCMLAVPSACSHTIRGGGWGLFDHFLFGERKLGYYILTGRKKRFFLKDRAVTEAGDAKRA